MVAKVPAGLLRAAGVMVLALAICACAPLAAARENQQDGRYKLRYAGPGPCRGAYLSYHRFSTDYPAEMFMSRTADPVLWEVRTMAGTYENFGQFTFKALNRATSDPGFMVSDSLSCTDPVARIEAGPAGKRWRLQLVDRSRDRYRINVATRGPAKCGATAIGRLAPATPTAAAACGKGVTLLGLNATTLDAVWVMSRVGNPLPPPV